MYENVEEIEQAHAAEDERRRYLVDTFGENILTGTALDPPPAHPGRTAKLIDRARREQLREERQRQADETLDAALELELDRDAFATVMNNKRDGLPSSPADKARATRYVRANNIIRSSTPQRLAAQGRLGRKWRTS
jgi:hypothetical protein